MGHPSTASAVRRSIGGRRPAPAVALASLLAVLVAALPALPAGAAVTASDVPVAGWRPDGVTYAVRVVGATTFVGGKFSQVIAPDGTARARSNLAAFDTRTGALLDDFRADTNGPVRALASDGATLWVGGSYSSIGGVRRYRVAAVDVTSGAVRRAFRANANSNVYALDLRAGRLFLAGSFSTVAGASRGRAAAVDPARAGRPTGGTRGPTPPSTPCGPTPPARWCTWPARSPPSVGRVGPAWPGSTVAPVGRWCRRWPTPTGPRSGWIWTSPALASSPPWPAPATRWRRGTPAPGRGSGTGVPTATSRPWPTTVGPSTSGSTSRSAATPPCGCWPPTR